MDVHRKLLNKSLARWAKEAAPADGVEPVMPPAVVGRGGEEGDAGKAGSVAADSAQNANRLSGQAKRLDDWLKDNRHARAEGLRRQIKKAREKLEQRRAAFQLALQRIPALPLKPRHSPGMVALEDFVRVVDAMPSLDSGNLHDFRKLTKKARYVAESGGGHSSQTIAKALKCVQDAIGDWHDWQSLADEAKIALEKDGDELTAWLEGQAEHFLAAALSITERARAAFGGVDGG
jgi:CHAD domain-containing protein